MGTAAAAAVANARSLLLVAPGRRAPPLLVEHSTSWQAAHVNAGVRLGVWDGALHVRGSFATASDAGLHQHQHHHQRQHCRGHTALQAFLLASSSACYPHQQKLPHRLRLPALRPVAAVSAPWPAAMDMEIVVDVLPVDFPEEQAQVWEEIAEKLKKDAMALLQHAIFPPPSPTLFAEGAEEGEDEEEEFTSAAELSIVLCSDAYIQGLNSQWCAISSPTDGLLLGDVVISMETAQRQADERGYGLLDELRVLLVHGVLHLLGHDHEAGAEEGMAEAMAAEEQRLMRVLRWVGQGLVLASQAPEAGQPAGAATMTDSTQEEDANARSKSWSGSSSSGRGLGSRPRVLFLDMDGTLLNSQSRITPNTADALRAAHAQGVEIIIATGKARPAAMAALQTVDLTGPNNILSTTSPGVFLQGLRVYGRGGKPVLTLELHEDVCREAFLFSLEHKLALIGFDGDRCVTLLPHPLVDELHDRYYEPKAELLPSVDALLQAHRVQKLLFFDTAEGVSKFLRPYWSLAVAGRATVTQAVAEMLEILPHGASKGRGVKAMLDHLQVSPQECMAVGDGENDLEMLQLVGLGVAMANAAAKTKAVANAHVASNDEDGVAEAIEKYILS
eukprot:jgi/Chlat1/8714/Chrsp89S08088